MRVAFVNSLYSPWAAGGAEATLQGLAEGLARKGVAVRVYCLSPPQNDTEQRHINGVTVHYLRPRTALWPWGHEGGGWRKAAFQIQEIYNPWAENDLARALEPWRPDIVHVHNFKGFSALGVWRAAQRVGAPVVQTLHDYTLVCPRSVMRKEGRNCHNHCLSCRVLSAPRRAAACRPERFTAVSHRMVERMNDCGVRWLEAPIIVRGDNPPGIVPRIRRVRSPMVFGFLGRLDPTKGLEVLLEASRLYEGPACRVLIAGTGTPAYEKKLKEAAAQSGRVEFVGWSNAQQFYAHIDVLVVPSVWEEPLGRVVHEAFGYGVPVIASKIGGIPEIVRDGDNGLLTPVNNAAALARAMEQLAGAPRRAETMAEEAARSAPLFDADRIHEQYLGVLKAVVSRRRSSAAESGQARDMRRRPSSRLWDR